MVGKQGEAEGEGMKKILIGLIIALGIIIAGLLFFYFRPLSLLQLLDSLRPVSTSLPVQPKINLTFVKGMWMPSVYLDYESQTIEEPERLRHDGVNTLAFPVEYRVDAEGKRVTAFGRGFGKEEKHVVSIIRKYKKEGFAIFLTPELRYVPRGEGGEPLGIPQSLQNDPIFFEGFNEFVLNMAKLAEKENVEYFAPMDEPDYRLGDRRAKIWSQEILPQVRQRFSGKLIYKSGSVPSSKVSYFDFSGYDVAGVTIVVLSRGEYNEEDYRKMVKTVIADLEATAQRDGVPEIWISGFGVWEGIQTPLTEKQKADVYQIVFEEAEGKVTGLVPWENTFFPLKGTLAEEVIKEWFKERIK